MYRYLHANPYRKVIGNYEYYEDKVAGKGTNSVVFQGKRINSEEAVCIKQITIRSAVA